VTTDSDSAGQPAGERLSDVAAREAAVGAREREVDAREAATAERADDTEELLHNAAERDSLAEFRDAAALHRDAGAAINEFFSQKRPETGTLRARGAAALDRTDARYDRAASKRDRSQLAEAEQSEPGGEG
jgi:hypothetical protein